MVLPNTHPHDDPSSDQFDPERIIDAIASYLVGLESCRERHERGEVVRWPGPAEFWP